MEAVLLIGIQGSGKSTFYRARFFETHVRLSLDLLRTRARERAFLRTCLRTGQRFVVDNTNVRRAERAAYIEAAKAAGFRVLAYYFPPELKAALVRNERRVGKARIPPKGVVGTLKRLEPPTWAEGYDALYVVRVTPEHEFAVGGWPGDPPEQSS